MFPYSIDDEIGSTAMEDQQKSKAQLIQELQDLRQRVKELEASTDTEIQVEATLGNHEQLQTLMNVMPARTVILDAQGRYVNVIKHNHPDGNYQPDNVIGKSLYDVQTKDFADFCMLKIREILETNAFQVIEYGFVNSIGQKIYHEGHLAPLVDSKTGETHVVWVSRDISKQKLAEQGLKRSEERLRTLVEALPDRAVVFDADGRYLDVIKRDYHTGVFQLGLDNVIGKTLHEVQTQEFADFCLSIIRKTIASNAVQIIEYSLPNLSDKMGASVYYEGHIAPLYETETGETHVLWISRDITQRKQAEQALLESEERLRSFVDVLPDRAVILNTEGRYLDVIKRRQDTSSYQPEGVVGKTLYDFESKAFADFCVAKIRETVETGTIQVIEYDFINQVGAHVYYEGRIAPLQSDNLQEPRVLWVSRDISKNKEAERATKESEERFRLISSVTSDYAFSSRFNEHGRLKNTFLSGAFERITSYSADEFLADGALRRNMIHPDDREQDDRNMQRLYNNQQAISELRIVAKNNQVRWVRMYLHPIWDVAQNKLIGFDGGVQDITAQKQAQLELDRYQYHLETLVEERTAELQQEIAERKQLEAVKVRQERLAAVGQLAAGIAHDFNNVMGVIMLDSDLVMRSPNLTEREQQKLERIQNQARHAANLIEQILDFSRRSVREPQVLDLRIVLNEIIKFLKRTIPERIQVQFIYTKDQFAVNLDPTQFQQVITNLAVNAKDAIEGNGKLDFYLSLWTLPDDDVPPVPEMPSGTWVKLVVADSGSGVAPENIGNLFEPFFTTKEVGKGTGLGLAQVYGIVQQHDGYITVESELGQGTTFSIYFPLAEGSMMAIPETRDGSLEEGQGETVLLVEDNDDLLEALTAVLETLNYQVLQARNGEEALSIYDDNRDKINLVLSDVVMPRMDGVELVRQLLQYEPTPKILMMSGFRQDAKITPDIEAAVIAWLQKPLDTALLAEHLQIALSQEIRD